VTVTAPSNNYNQYQHFLQQSSQYASGGASSSHIYSNLNRLVVVGEETNIASASSPISPAVTTATTTPTKRVQVEEVGDVQMVSMDCLNFLFITPVNYFFIPKRVPSKHPCLYLFLAFTLYVIFFI
jgi:ABC-type Na+ efflux pump permease subunit